MSLRSLSRAGSRRGSVVLSRPGSRAGRKSYDPFDMGQGTFMSELDRLGFHDQPSARPRTPARSFSMRSNPVYLEPSSDESSSDGCSSDDEPWEKRPAPARRLSTAAPVGYREPFFSDGDGYSDESPSEDEYSDDDASSDDGYYPGAARSGALVRSSAPINDNDAAEIHLEGMFVRMGGHLILEDVHNAFGINIKRCFTVADGNGKAFVRAHCSRYFDKYDVQGHPHLRKHLIHVRGNLWQFVTDSHAVDLQFTTLAVSAALRY